MNNPNVLIAILNWNGKSYLEKFLPYVLASNYPNYEILVIDNASTDDSVAFLNEIYPQVSLRVLSQNVGFAGGYNQGLVGFSNDYFVLLNSDVEVSPNWLHGLVESLENNRQMAVVQPKIKNYFQKEDFEHAGAAGGMMDTWGFPFCRGRIFNQLEKDEHQFENAEIFWASGAAFCIRRSVWEELKGFDTDFFAHMEEIDLCWRIKNKGYQIGYVKESEVFHVGGGTLQVGSPFKNYLNFRNNLFMLQKNLPAKNRYLKIFIRMSIDFIAWLKFISEGKYKMAFSINKAHWHFIKNLSKTEHKRILKNPPNASHIYQKSIVWAFYYKKKQKFNELNLKDFS